MVQVRFGNDEIVNGFVPTMTAKQPLSLEWNSLPDTLTTVIMYDLEGNVHLLITNIKGNDIDSGTPLVEYNAPLPSVPRLYNIDIYQQPSIIDNNEISNLQEFIRTNGLKLVDRASFQIGSKVPTIGSKVPTIGTRKSRKFETAEEKANYFIPGTTLTEQQQKWCRCVLKVADKQKGACNTEQAWFQTRENKTCYNPFAVCSASVGTSTRECGDNLNFEALSDDYLLAYAQLHQNTKHIIRIPEPYDRSQMLRNIAEWKFHESK